jgi:fatty acid desaturase
MTNRLQLLSPVRDFNDAQSERDRLQIATTLTALVVFWAETGGSYLVVIIVPFVVSV